MHSLLSCASRTTMIPVIRVLVVARYTTEALVACRRVRSHYRSSFIRVRTVGDNGRASMRHGRSRDRRNASRIERRCRSEEPGPQLRWEHLARNRDFIAFTESGRERWDRLLGRWEVNLFRILAISHRHKVIARKLFLGVEIAEKTFAKVETTDNPENESGDSQRA